MMRADNGANNTQEGTALILTWGYNSAKTIGRTVESILGQTYKEWVYYLIDNGSTDGTAEIINKYTMSEPRIHAFYFPKNTPNLKYDPQSLKYDSENYDYLVFLDADDEYKPDFLENSIAFMERNNCDIVCCGSDFIDAQTGCAVGSRSLPMDMVIEGNMFNNQLSVYYQYIRTLWGKLHRRSIIDAFDFYTLNSKNMTNGRDTYHMLMVLKQTRRLGILSGTYHKYYMNQKAKSAYTTWLPKRSRAYATLYDAARDFLISKAGYVSPINNEFLLAVYMNALNDTLKVLLGAELPEAEKLDALREMFLCEHARKLAAYERFGALIGDEIGQTQRRRELFSEAERWLLSREEVADEQVEGYCELGEFLSAASEDSGGWIFFKKLLARFLIDQGRLDEARPKLDELAELLPEDEETAELSAACK
jgi:glycosyltransferase involved in cell wall biosynthesis